MSAPVLPTRLFVYVFADPVFGPCLRVHETRVDSENDRPQAYWDDCSPVTEFVDAAELTRLRAALASIAALQTEEPTHGDGLHGLGLWQAAEMARAALVSK